MADIISSPTSLRRPLFPPVIDLHRPTIEDIVRTHWGLELGLILKASQNHTFVAADPVTGLRYCVRVTPDPDNHNSNRFQDEVAFVMYLVEVWV